MQEQSVSQTKFNTIDTEAKGFVAAGLSSGITDFSRQPDLKLKLAADSKKSLDGHF